MITVEIRKNGKLLYKMKAVNIGVPMKPLGKHMRQYRLDDNDDQVILHNRKKGVVRLAIKMLRTLRGKDDEWIDKNFTDADLH